MDPLSNHSSIINPTYLDIPLLAAQAQQLLQRVGWTYYTIWKKDSTQSPLSTASGLAWSHGDVNRSSLGDQINLYGAVSCGNRNDSQQIIKACKMGSILQQFYRNCSFLPLGLGIAGIAMASGRYRWACGEELLKQISLLSTFNRRNVPPDLQERFFETVVCIPLENGAGVLEMGTKPLVPEGTDGIQLAQMLGFIDHGLATGSGIGSEEKILNSQISTSGSGLIPCYKAGQYQYGDSAEHNNALKVMQVYGGRAIFRQSSISSSYCSSSSAASSPLSAADPQKASSSSITLQNCSNQLDILNQLDHIELHAGSSSSICDQQQLNTNADQHGASHASQHHVYSSHPALYFSVTNLTASPLLSSLPPHNTRQHDQQHFCQDNLPRGNQQPLQQWDKPACAADHHINMEHYAGGRSAVRAPSEAFMRWSRPSFTVSCERNKKKAAKDSLLKKLLIVYLPTHRGTRGLLQAQEPIEQLNHPSSVIMTTNESTQNEAAMNHVYAERIRRSKQAACYKALRNLLPNIAKKDKVGTLEHSIEYLKELKGRVCELEQAKDALTYMKIEDNNEVARNSSTHTSSHAIARCLCLPPYIYKDGNYFQLNVTKIINKHEDTNITNIDILSALQKKNLRCIKLRSEFQRNTRKLDIQILAKYKDVENCTLSMDGIREIEEWWPNLMKDV